MIQNTVIPVKVCSKKFYHFWLSFKPDHFLLCEYTSYSLLTLWTKNWIIKKVFNLLIIFGTNSNNKSDDNNNNNHWSSSRKMYLNLQCNYININELYNNNNNNNDNNNCFCCYNKKCIINLLVIHIVIISWSSLRKNINIWISIMAILIYIYNIINNNLC